MQKLLKNMWYVRSMFQFMELNHIDSPVKRKGQGAAVSDENHVDSLLGHENTYDNWFSWKDATTYNAFYCKLFRQYSLYLLNDPRIYAPYIYIYIYIYVYISSHADIITLSVCLSVPTSYFHPLLLVCPLVASSLHRADVYTSLLISQYRRVHE